MSIVVKSVIELLKSWWQTVVYQCRLVRLVAPSVLSVCFRHLVQSLAVALPRVAVWGVVLPDSVWVVDACGSNRLRET